MIGKGGAIICSILSFLHMKGYDSAKNCLNSVLITFNYSNTIDTNVIEKDKGGRDLD